MVLEGLPYYPLSAKGSIPFIKIGTTAANVHAYSDTDVASGNSYSYRVRAFTQSAARPYANGYSMFTGCVSATMP